MFSILRKSLLCLVFSLCYISFCTPVFATSFSTGGVRINKKIKPMRDIKHENVVSQSMDVSCGPAGLSTLLNFYLQDPTTEIEIINSLLNQVPLEKVRERKGFTLLDLKNFAKAKGYDVTGYKDMDIEFLREIKRPVLVPISFKNFSHFVIVKGVIADRIFIADPTAGNMSMKTSKFEKIWTKGIGLVVEKPNHNENTEYALQVNTEDLLISDYKRLRQLIDKGAIRTAIYPSEWK